MSQFFTRRSFFVGTMAAAVAASSGRARASASPHRLAAPPRKLILMVAAGGWDTTYVLDPKPGLTTVDGPGGTIREIGGLTVFVDPSRPAPTRFFEKHAASCHLVNGIQTQSIVHADCSKRLLTGTPSDANPDIGAIAAYEHGRHLAAPYFVLGQTAYTGPYASVSTRAGTANQLGALVHPLLGLPVGDPQAPQLPFVADSVEAQLIRDYRQASTARALAQRGQTGRNQRRLQDFEDAAWRGEAVAEIGAVGDIDFSRDLMVQVELALDGLQSGLCHAVQLELGGWDTHANNASQAALNEVFFTGLERLVDELAARPGDTPGARMLDETVVVALSEMGRTPKLNTNAGKDHWPVTSALVIGAGVAGGRVSGETDDRLGAMGIDFTTGATLAGGPQLTGANFAAGVLRLAGVDFTRHLPVTTPLAALAA
ncbi:MAG: DUF1501 domain-containing protein [Myxococcales bacterium FL481]|nr:MAG: DUF1501 domain-containing protein [Myxococcales bacterium FL481]